ncbi:MAG: helix-turn-helix transcriptional regulator [Phenylobacterium sp.]|uniref:helix-turn-helix transcriptional regulator n=1 Tax=Phenylobacterium sp. TaxID=1871053 RepID=UPI003918CA0F
MKTTADAILLILKTRGPTTAGALAARLGISRQAVVQQIDRLLADGLVRAAAPPGGGVGRPSRAWSLTSRGHARFPDAHAQMTVELIEAVRAEFGEPGLDRLIARRERATAEAYAEALDGAAGVEARLERLAALRTAEGYMCEWTADGEGWLLIENHCPICAAAAACRGFCRSELDLFRDLLAPARVERTDHLLAGARRCAYRVTPA